jgi:hypothetical protein
MTRMVSTGNARQRWRGIAALLAVVAMVSLVHWHPLFEDSGSETLRDAANQCAACTSGTGPAVEPSSSAPSLLPVAPLALPLPDPLPAVHAPRRAPPRAPPC